MSRNYNATTIKLLEFLAQRQDAEIKVLYKHLGQAKPYKEFYNLVFRLVSQGLVKKDRDNVVTLTGEGNSLLQLINPKRDGVWKMVIFDIPEKHHKVRSILRAKLKQLHFKKWQNSIWISPYVLPKSIEEEFTALGQKFFIRLIKTSEINIVEDLQKLFDD